MRCPLLSSLFVDLSQFCTGLGLFQLTCLGLGGADAMPPIIFVVCGSIAILHRN